MTHLYTVCEQNYEQRGECSRFMPDESGLKVGCGGGSSRVTHISRHDPLEEELDPCLSAAVRYKKEANNGLLRVKYLLCCIVVLLALALLAIALLMVFGTDGSPDHLQRTKQFNEGNTSEGIQGLQENGSVTKFDSIHQSKVMERKFKETHMRTGHQPVAMNPHEVATRGNYDWAAFAITPMPSLTQKPALRKVIPFIATTTSQSTTLSSTTKKKIPETLRDCEYHNRRGDETGVYQVVLPGYGDFYARCLMEEGHGWIVWHNRTSDKWSFWNNTFEEYASGFGELTEGGGGNGWLGLHWIHALSELGGKLEMRIRLEGDLCGSKTKRSCSGFGGDGRWWGDWEFTLSGQQSAFSIGDLRYLRGNLSDKEPGLDLFSHLCNNQKFTTVDEDNDTNPQQNCALFRERGAWWHGDCAHTVLNGRYGVTSASTYGQSWNRASPQQAASTHGAYIIKPQKSLILVRISSR